MTDSPDDFALSRADALGMVSAIGGVEALASGSWFLRMLSGSLRAFRANFSAQYFQRKYPRMDKDRIANRLIKVASNYAALFGAGSGLVMSAGEVSAIVTAGAAAPAAVTAAFVGLGVDLVSTVWIQTRLISALAALYGPALDPDDPEDVLLAMQFFLSAKGGDTLVAGATKGGGVLTRRAVRKYMSKATLKSVQDKTAMFVGRRLTQRAITNMAVPVASIAIGGGFSYVSTRMVGRRAQRVMRQRGADLAIHGVPSATVAA